eukprot:1081398-Prorocentrum_minimum.AAC.4
MEATSAELLEKCSADERDEVEARCDGMCLLVHVRTTYASRRKSSISMLSSGNNKTLSTVDCRIEVEGLFGRRPQGLSGIAQWEEGVWEVLGFWARGVRFWLA